MSRVAQLGVVALALIFVLAAGGYGITRGLQSNLPMLPNGCRHGTAGWLPVINKVVLPSERELPEGVRLATACYGSGVVTVFYANQQGDKVLLVTILNIDFQGIKRPPTGAPIQLGNLVGQVSDETKADGRFYFISFDKRGWEYGVGAGLGKNPNRGRPDNKVTIDEITAIALSMAER